MEKNEAWMMRMLGTRASADHTVCKYTTLTCILAAVVFRLEYFFLATVLYWTFTIKVL